MTWNSAFIAPNQKNITRKFKITSKRFPNIMKLANCRNYILKPGLSIFQVKFYTDPQLGNIFFNSVKLISMSTNSSRYWNKIKLNSRSSENGRSSGWCVKELHNVYARWENNLQRYNSSCRWSIICLPTSFRFVSFLHFSFRFVVFRFVSGTNSDCIIQYDSKFLPRWGTTKLRNETKRNETKRIGRNLMF
jgi:hypothetical protein